MRSVHQLSTVELSGLATGGGDPATLRNLWRSQHSRRLLTLRLLFDDLRPDPDHDAAREAILAAEAADRTAARQVLVDPLVGAWSARTLRRLNRAETVAPADRLHLGAVAAAAALRSGSRAEVHAHARDGWLHLPTVGRATAPDGPVSITVDDGRMWIDGREVELSGPGFEPLHRLHTEDGPVVALDDVDPYRNAFHVPAAGRLTRAEAGTWQRRFTASWLALGRYAPGRAAEIGTGLRTLVPLTMPDPDAAHSATAGDAVGVVALDLPRTPAEFAVTLVHEFQHSKLTAVLDIVTLCDRSSRRTFRVPWRTDRRPVDGLLQGVYAFLGVAETWQALSADPDRFPQAATEFADARAQVTDGYRALAGSGLLTAVGTRFVAGLGRAVEALHTTHRPASVVARPPD